MTGRLPDPPDAGAYESSVRRSACRNAAALDFTAGREGFVLDKASFTDSFTPPVQMPVSGGAAAGLFLIIIFQ